MLNAKLTSMTMLALVVSASSAQAGFVKLLVVDAADNAAGLKEYTLYGVFDVSSDFLVGVIHADIQSTTGFFHSTFEGEKSATPWTTAENELSIPPDVDSFVTIGKETGDDNLTSLFGQFDVGAFLNGNSIGPDAAWTQMQPQGIPDEEGKVLIATLVPTKDLYDVSGELNGTMTIAWSDGGPTGVTFTQVSFETSPSCNADLDGSGMVDGADLGLLLASWGTTDPQSDLNADGTIDGADLGLLLSQWESSCVLGPSEGQD